MDPQQLQDFIERIQTQIHKMEQNPNLQAVRRRVDLFKKHRNLSIKDALRKLEQTKTIDPTLFTVTAREAHANLSECLEKLQKPEGKELWEVLMIIDQCKIHIQTLIVLAEKAKRQYAKNPTALMVAAREVFGETHANPDPLLLIITNFSNIIVPSVAERIIDALNDANAVATKPEHPTPGNQPSTNLSDAEQITRILGYQNKIQSQYNDLSPSNTGPFSWAREKSRNSFRDEQIALLEKSLKYLAEHPSSYSQAVKIQIIQGLMLTIKHQIGFSFNSRLKTVVDKIWQENSVLFKMGNAQDAINIFNGFFKVHSKELMLSERSLKEMPSKIEKTYLDAKWLTKQNAKPRAKEAPKK